MCRYWLLCFDVARGPVGAWLMRSQGWYGLMLVLTGGMVHGFGARYDMGDMLLRCLVAERTALSILQVWGSFFLYI